jgi:hypothetical protein
MNLNLDDPTNKVGEAQLHVEDDQVVADCTFNTAGIAEQISAGKLSLRTRGVGSVDSQGVVGPDYEFVSLVLTADPA